MATDRIEIRNSTIRLRPVPPPPAPTPFSTETTEELSQYRIVMETSKGNIVIEVLPDKAPNHVRHLLRLASLGAFDKTGFHRIALGFIIQACDPNTCSEPTPR